VETRQSSGVFKMAAEGGKVEWENFIKDTLKAAEDRYLLSPGIDNAKFISCGNVFKLMEKLVPHIVHEKLSISQAKSVEGRVVVAFPMASRELAHWCSHIKRRLRRKNLRRNPWSLEFVRNIDEEVFDIILSVLASNSYYTTTQRDKKCIKVIITHRNKLVYYIYNDETEI